MRCHLVRIKLASKNKQECEEKKLGNTTDGYTDKSLKKALW